MASLSEMQPSPEMKEQTLAVYDQAPSSLGEEVMNTPFTWNCRRNRACCMEGPIWALGRNLERVLPVQKIGTGAPMTTALGCNCHVSFLKLSLWWKSTLSWFMGSLVTKTNCYQPNLSPTAVPDHSVKPGFTWLSFAVIKQVFFPSIIPQEELCWVQMWKDLHDACAYWPFKL